MRQPLLTTTHPNYRRETDMPKTWGDAGSLVGVGLVTLLGGIGVFFLLMAICVAWYAAAHEQNRRKRTWMLLGMAVLTGGLCGVVAAALSNL